MMRPGQHPHDWRRDRSKPRVIRKVVSFYKTPNAKKGRPKVARDRKTGTQMEHITARTEKDCAYHACPNARIIEPGTEFARVIRPTDRKRIGMHDLPDPKDFHFECVPPEARPLVRFFVSRNTQP